MKAKKTEAHVMRKAAAPPEPSRWPLFAAIAAGLIAVFWAYGPSFHGPFLFDDSTLPFGLPNFTAPLSEWVSGLRPLLMFTYWVNTQISGADPYSYHLVNMLIHCTASALMFFIVRRIVEWGGVEPDLRTPLAGFCALLFLLHPVQTEAVAYLAGRSEALSSMMVFAAFAAFLYRKETAVTWTTAALVLLLFVGALASKEQTIVLPALLLLTDYWWNPGFSFRGIRDNWKLYAPLALGALAGLIRFLPLLTHATTAGFGLKDLTWYDYLFTEFRAIFVYIREFFLPFGLTADWDFPFSHSIVDHGAIVGLIVLLALVAACWIFRKRFPLASYGFLAFLILLSPTSSILPIRDPIAERRLYFAMFGLLLVAAEILRRVKVSRTALTAACAALLLFAAIGTHARAEVWSSELSLWQDVTAKSPDKARDHFQLANAYFDLGTPEGCAQSVAEYEKTAQYKPDGYTRYNVLVDWGLALDCANQPDAALARFAEAARLEKTAHVYSQIAKVHGEQGRWTEALDALHTAETLDPKFAPTYAYRGIVYLKTNKPADAIPELQRALQLDPSLEPARQALRAAQQQLRMQPQLPAGAGH